MTTELEKAVASIKAGDTEKGKELLVRAIRQNPKDERAWLWMSRCVADPRQKRDCFERVLRINPQNRDAIAGLRGLNRPARPKDVQKPEPPKTKRIPTLLIVTAVVGLVLLGVFGSYNLAQFFHLLPAPGRAVAEPTQTSLPAAIPEEVRGNWSTVNVRELAKSPNGYIGQELHYKGDVFRIEEDSKGAVLHVWVLAVGGGSLDYVAVIVHWAGEATGIFEGTQVEFWGHGLPPYEETNDFGKTIQQPAIEADYLTYVR
jgi:hypothetical protein